MNLAIGCTNGNRVTAISALTPVCTNAICFVVPTGIPSDTMNPASQIVPVVPIFAPNTAAIAEGSGNAPLATSPTIAVVESELDCHNRVHTIPPRNIQYGFEIKYSKCSNFPIDFIPPENIFNPI